MVFVKTTRRKHLSKEELKENIKQERLIISGLEKEISAIGEMEHIELTEGQKRDYEIHNSKHAHLLKPYKDERDYLMRQAQGKISRHKQQLTKYKNRLTCERFGHNYRPIAGYIGSGLGPGKSSKRCLRCGDYRESSSTINPKHIILKKRA